MSSRACRLCRTLLELGGRFPEPTRARAENLRGSLAGGTRESQGLWRYNCELKSVAARSRPESRRALVAWTGAAGDRCQAREHRNMGIETMGRFEWRTTRRSPGLDTRLRRVAKPSSSPRRVRCLGLREALSLCVRRSNVDGR